MNLPAPVMQTVTELADAIRQSDCILVGAGAGLSAAAGLNYLDSEIFAKYYPDMAKFGYEYQYQLVGENDWSKARMWAYWATHINYVRNIFPSAPLYHQLLKILLGRDFFVVTSNTDRQFLRAGFPAERLFEYQGNYDVFKCTAHPDTHTWDNHADIQNILQHIDHEKFECEESAFPVCPFCGAPAQMGFRPSNYEALTQPYIDFIERCRDKTLCLIEFGVGYNTPGVIRWPFDRITYYYEHAHLFRVNRGYREWAGHAGFPDYPAELEGKVTPINWDAKEVIEALANMLRIPS